MADAVLDRVNGRNLLAHRVARESPVAPAIVYETDAILGKHGPVLDRGFMPIVEYFGEDVGIVAAARFSYGSGTNSVSELQPPHRFLSAARHRAEDTNLAICKMLSQLEPAA